MYSNTRKEGIIKDIIDEIDEDFDLDKIDFDDLEFDLEFDEDDEALLGTTSVDWAEVEALRPRSPRRGLFLVLSAVLAFGAGVLLQLATGISPW